MTEFWTTLGLPGLADVHTHFLPERMQRRVWAHFDSAATQAWTDSRRSPGPLIGREWPITYRGDLQERVEQLRAFGVRHFSALAYAHRPGMAADLNEWTLDFAARTPGCLPSATFFPEPSAVADVRGALDRGARIFKLHLQVGGFDPRDALLDGVWGLLAEAGTPVVVHAGSGPVAARFTGTGPIGDVLARHPRLTMLTAHLGGPEYLGFIELAERYERVGLDTTMAFTDFTEQYMPFPRELRPRLRELGLAGKVFLGSDFPNIPYQYGHQLEALTRLDLGDEWLRAVCWRNARGLFGLD